MFTILVGFWADEDDGEVEEEEGEDEEEEELVVFLLVRDWGCWPEEATVIGFFRRRRVSRRDG